MERSEGQRTEPLSVLVVEPSQPLREAIKWVLSHNERCLLTGEARDEEEAMAKAAELQPAMVLLDVGVAAGGMAALGRLARAFPETRVVALLSDYSDEYRSSAHAHGAFACVAMEHLEEHLAWAVQKALSTPGAAVFPLEE
ncbi:MAG: response regulator [Dehalococcoidia bacterium]